jgi:protein involved in polysaccharide export with SLBB domain
LLQPFDAIFIAELSNFKQQKAATIQGQVVRSGIYPIRPDTTTVCDLVTLAGGFTPEASLLNATLRRQPLAGGNPATSELQNTPPEFLTDIERQISQIRSRGDQTNVVIDFERLYAQGTNACEQKLETGDVITVPRRRDDVVVLGAVTQPGIVEFTPGRGVSHYLALAGGPSRRADPGDITILKGKLGTRVHWREVRSLDPGDQIIVPFKRQRTLLERVQTTQGLVTTVSGFILGVLGLIQLLN